MITEDYVSFETAKLLKEKGFNEDVLTYYAFDSETKQYDFKQDDRWDNPHNYGTYYVSAPTLQMAMKWLREEKDCPIEILWFYDADDQMQYWEFMHHKELGPLPPYELYETYENACEAAIKYCLKNLI